MREGPPRVDRTAPSSSRTDLELRLAGAEDIPRLKAVLAEAFFEDPVLGWLMPNDTKRRARMRRFFAIELRYLALPRGQVWTTADLTGAALSLPPGAWRVPLRATLLEGGAFGGRLSRAARLGAAIEQRHPREPHHYIRDVGILPEMQGKGLGSALMRPTLERSDREGLCPPISRHRASAAPRYMNASASGSSASCVSAAVRHCVSCSARHTPRRPTERPTEPLRSTA
jgi:GNAT superfamily N-acetyltransferase